MRWTAFLFLVACCLWLAGCEGGSGSTTTASAGGAPPPPMPPGGAPAAPPPAPSDAPPPGGPAPSDGAAAAPGEGGLAPPTSDTSPPNPNAQTGTPDSQPPGDTFNPNPGNPNGPNSGQPGDENPDGTPRRPPPPRTLRDQAYAAFRSGNDLSGFKLLNAHYAVVPAAKEELAQKMAWVPGLMRPALGPRIGIAVHYVEIPLQFRGSPMPVGSQALTSAVDQMQQAEAADNRIGGTRRMSKYGRGMRGPMANFSENAKGDPMQNASAETQVNYYLGDFGEWLLEALQERMEAGEYGRVMQELSQQASRPMRRPGPGGPGGPDGQPGFPGGPGFGGGEDTPGAYGPGGPPGGGPGGGRFGGGGGRGRGRGQGGGAGDGGQSTGPLAGLPGEESTGGANPPRRWSTRAADKEAASLAQVKQLSPCILWLGKDEERDVINKRAEAANIDILAVFEMTLRTARTGNFVNNTTKLKLVNLRTGKPVPNFSAEPLVNLTVEQWRQKDEKGVDPVEREVTKAIEALDHALKPAPLPEAVTAERVKKRIGDLVAEKPADPLPVIVEARYYFAKGLLSEQEFTDAARELLGDAGLARLVARAREGE